MAIASINSFLRSLGRHALKGSRWVISRLPYRLFRLLGALFFAVGSCVMIRKVRLARNNLKLAFGREKSEEEIARIAKECFNNFGRGMVDLIYFMDRPEFVRSKVKFVGKENLDKALAKGNGAVLVGAHFGNFLLMYFSLIVAGYKVNVIMKRTRDTAFEEYISELRDTRGLKTIYDLPARKCVQESIRALRNNEVLFILLDQNYGSAGRIFVDFFGQKAATAAGPIVFANRTNSPILPIFIRGLANQEHVLTIHPEFPVSNIRNDDQEIAENIARLTKIIENKVREYPHEWGGWMHNRFKTKPVEIQRIIDRINDTAKLTQYA